MLYLGKNFSGYVVKLTNIIEFNEGSIVEGFPSFGKEAIFVKDKDPIPITIKNFRYITNSIMEVIDEDGNEFSIHCNDYEFVYIIL